MEAMTIQNTRTQLAIIDPTPNGAEAGVNDTAWLNYFSPQLARASVMTHVMSLPASQHSNKTMEAYMSAIDSFLEFSAGRLPSPTLVKMFVAYLKNSGRSASTIKSKYFSGLRHFFRALTSQHIQMDDTLPLKEAFRIRSYIEDCRLSIINSTNVKPPKPDTRSDLSPMYQHGNRLSLGQVNAILNAIDRETLAGQRDYALLQLGFTTGLRVDEIRRLTLDCFYVEDDVLMCKVRGKHMNFDPVAVDQHVYDHILTWVQAWNEAITEDDPRFIAGDVPIWQAVNHGDKPMAITRCKNAGMSTRALQSTISKRAAAVEIKLAAHDLRRTLAYNLDKVNAPIKYISAKLRHANTSTTERYIGKKKDYEGTLTANYFVIG